MMRASLCCHGVPIESSKNGYSRRCVDIAGWMREQRHKEIGATSSTGTGAKHPADGNYTRCLKNSPAGTNASTRADSTTGKG